jgi:ATP-binding cassette subfamily A (ABC1) protein 3
MSITTLICEGQAVGVAADDAAGMMWLKTRFMPFFTALLNNPDYYRDAMYRCPQVNASQYLQTSLFKPFDSAKALQAYTEDASYARDSAHPWLQGALILHQSVGKRWDYTVRCNGTRVQPMDSAVDGLQVGLPYYWDADVNGDRYSWGHPTIPPGFIQYIMDRLILADLNVLALPADVPSMFATHIEPFPSPAYYQDGFADSMQFSFGILMVVAFMWPLSRMVRNLVDEKENRTKEALRMIGVANSTFWLSWLVAYLCVLTPVCVVFTLISRALFLPNSSGLLVFLLYFLFVVNILCFACFLSTLFQRAQSAGTLSPFAFMVSYFPYFAVYQAQRGAWAK